jgi:hypothetical protein
MKEKVDKLLEGIDESTPFVISVTVFKNDDKQYRTECVVNNWPLEEMDGVRNQTSKVLFEIKADHEEFEKGLEDPKTSQAFSVW